MTQVLHPIQVLKNKFLFEAEGKGHVEYCFLSIGRMGRLNTKYKEIKQSLQNQQFSRAASCIKLQNRTIVHYQKKKKGEDPNDF